MRWSVAIAAVMSLCFGFLGCDLGGGGGGGGGGGLSEDALAQLEEQLPDVVVPTVPTKAELVVAYEQANEQAQVANKSFIDAYHAYATADPANPEDFLAKTKAMTAAGDAWLTAMLTLNGYGEQFLTVKADSLGKADAPILTAPTVPVTLPFNIGCLIGTTKEKVAQVEQAFNDGKIDETQKQQMLNELKKTQLLDTVGTGLSAGSAVAGGFVVKAGLVLAGASGGVVIGGTILGAAAIGLGVKLMWSWCSGGKKDSPTGETCALSTYDTTVGGVMPLQFPGKGTLIIQVDGKEPIVIEDFGVEGGQVVQVDFDPNNPGAGPTITTVDPTQFTDCTIVAGVSASPEPVDPGPGEGVTVTATTIPPMAGCIISFSIVGTDGYTNSASPTTDANGSATFYIPGGAEGVVDTVTISVGGQTTTVVYSF